MRMKLYKGLVAFCLLLGVSSVSLGAVITNGSFETGDFTGWTTVTTGMPFEPWQVTGAGLGGSFGMAPTSPQDGAFVAWNGFDGGGPMQFLLFQDITIPTAGGVLSWMDRIQWNLTAGSVASLPRDYLVEILDPMSNALLQTLFSFTTGDPAVNPTGDTTWQTHTVDLAAFAGSTVRLQYREEIPESFTGPGQLEIDDVRVPESAVPEPTTLALLGLGLAGLGFARRRRVH